MMVPLRFFTGLASGLAIVFVIYFGLVQWQLGAPTTTSYWSYDLNSRKQARAASIPDPKLLVIGGSGALFGINARILESELGVPTVNLSTHAALQVAYILTLARTAARPGDTVLLALEYELYEAGNSTMNQWADPLFIDFLMARDPAYFRSLPVGDQFDLSMRLSRDRLKRGLKSILRPPPPPEFQEYTAYDSKNVDEYGDMTGHTRARIPNRVTAEFDVRPALTSELSNARSGMTEIQEFIDWSKAHGVRVLATFPNLCETPDYLAPKAQSTAEEITAFFQSRGVPMVGDYRGTLLPRADFYDTSYHLTEEAAAERTRRLATQLKSHFQPKQP